MRLLHTGFILAAATIALLAATLRAQAPAAKRPATQPTRQGPDGTLKFLAIDADVQGQKARVEKKGNNPHNIGYWTNKDDKAVWHGTLEKGGKFTVEVEYSLDQRAQGAEYVIELNDKSIHVKPEVTGTWLDFKTATVGEVELAPGKLKLVVRGEKKPGQAVLDLRGVTLKPAGG
jgi:hypothetical protein